MMEKLLMKKHFASPARTFLFVIFFHGLCQLSHAGNQTPTLTPKPQPPLTQQDLKEFLPNTCYLTGDYEQSAHLKALPNPLVSKGQFLFDCHYGLAWHNRHPMVETLIYSLGKHHYKIDDSGQKQKLQTGIHRRLAKMLTSLIGGDSRYLYRYFEPRWKIGAKHQHLQLQPKKPSLARVISLLEIEKTAQGISIHIHKAKAGKTQIDMSKLTQYQADSSSPCPTYFTAPSPICQVLQRGAI